ncbi:MAG: methyltransferase protein [Rhodospirillales bacterium]|nr:methyltransferase protein [Rhodospirillales bacterium]
MRAGNDTFRDIANNPAFLNFLPEIAARDVIDLGCGEGLNTRLFARRGARMTGIDLSAKLIEAAIESERTEPLGIQYHVGSYTDLSGFGAESFNGAVSTMALMDGPDFQNAASSTFRILRPGGWFCFSVTHPCFATPVNRWVERDGEVEGKLVGDYWRDRPFVERWGFSDGPSKDEPFSIWYFPYRLEDYINGLIDAGFRIQRIAEPRPTEAMVAANPRLAPHRQHTPHVLYVAATKD